jgi:hypothetical protein
MRLFVAGDTSVNNIVVMNRDEKYLTSNIHVCYRSDRRAVVSLLFILLLFTMHVPRIYLLIVLM